MREVIEPTIRGLAKDGTPYTGFLYAGIMVHPDGTPNVLEYNCRFGDPETQPIMMRLNSDLVELCEAALDKRLDRVHAEWDERAALGVVLAAEGYPDDRAQGRCHRRARRRGQTTGQGIPCRHPRRAGPDPDARRPRVVRRGPGRERLAGAGKGLRAGERDFLEGYAMPTRHRVSRGRERTKTEAEFTAGHGGRNEHESSHRTGMAVRGAGSRIRAPLAGHAAPGKPASAIARRGPRSPCRTPTTTRPTG